MSVERPPYGEPAFEVTPRPDVPAKSAEPRRSTNPRRSAKSGHSAQAGHSAEPSRRPGRGPLLLAGAVGFALAGLLAAALLAAGVLPTPGGSLQRSTDPIRLPTSAGRFVVQETALASASSTRFVADHLAAVNRRSTAALRRAYGGAAADVHVYATQELLAFLTVSAVRSNSARLYAVYQDLTFDGPAPASDRIVTYGSVDCEVVSDPRGGPVRAAPSRVRMCQRTGGGLTVRVDSLVGLDDLGPRAVATLLDEVWGRLT